MVGPVAMGMTVAPQGCCVEANGLQDGLYDNPRCSADRCLPCAEIPAGVGTSVW